jgi:hypothetical protein
MPILNGIFIHVAKEARENPEGSMRLRFPDFKTIGT